MRCLHCLKHFHDPERQLNQELRAAEGQSPMALHWFACRIVCPACSGDLIFLGYAQRSAAEPNPKDPPSWTQWRTVHPKSTARPVPAEVPAEFAGDFQEAAVVLADSAKASAALSRRCLQNVLHDKLNIKRRNLDEEIQALLDSKILPSQIAEAVDAVRTVGNFAAHPIKSQQTGVVTDVEPGEAEWTLEVLESLFDFLFVAPAKLAERRTAVNKKLAEAGKPPLK